MTDLYDAALEALDVYEQALAAIPAMSLHHGTLQLHRQNLVYERERSLPGFDHAAAAARAREAKEKRLQPTGELT